MTKLLLFIPFYNCEKQLPRVLEKVKPYQHFFEEILLVDNQSQDKSLLVAENKIRDFEKATLVRNKENYNLGGSHKVAFQYAQEKRFDYLIVLHGDDQGDIADLLPYLINEDYKNFDCLLGARFHPLSTLEGYSRFRTFGNIVVNHLCQLTCRRQILDMGSGLNMYSRSFISDPRIISFPNDLTFNVFLLFHSCFIDSKLHFFPLKWREFDQVSNARVFKQFFIILKLILRCLLNRSALYDNQSQSGLDYEIIR